MITLADMISADRGALLCDLAEVYGITDFGMVPVPVLATLAVGLRDDSRIKMKMTGDKLTKTEMLLAAILDRLSVLVWQQTEDGRNGTNYPKSVLNHLLGSQSEDGNVRAYDSAEDFDNEWKRITGVNYGG